MRTQPYARFRCPVCQCPKYVRVQVKRSDGSWYITSFYQCFACSVMFLDPEKFSGNMVSGDGVDRSPRTMGPPPKED